MNILVLHGPNMNLIGVRSSRVGHRLTLDRLDTALKDRAKELDITLKTLQTHYPGKAITFLQRNRNWAEGLLFSPGPWSKSHYDILDTLKLVQIPAILIYFTPDFDPENYANDSIFNHAAIGVKKGFPIDVYSAALTDLHLHLLSPSNPC